MDVYTLAFEWTETNRHWLIEVPIRLVAYTVVVLIARYVLHRMIDRATTGRTRKPRSEDIDAPVKRPPLLRHLKDRAASSANAARIAARRQQRAQTIGSVLKSTVSIVLLTWLVLAASTCWASTSRHSSPRRAWWAWPSASARRTWSATS